MANPQIIYTPAGGTQQTLSFTSPPQQQPAYEKSAVRHDNVSTAGIRESVLERIDQFMEISLDWIRAGTDLANWTAFLDFALTGAAFAYYPDSSVNFYTNYVLDDSMRDPRLQGTGSVFAEIEIPALGLGCFCHLSLSFVIRHLSFVIWNRPRARNRRIKKGKGPRTKDKGRMTND